MSNPIGETYIVSRELLARELKDKAWFVGIDNNLYSAVFTGRVFDSGFEVKVIKKEKEDGNSQGEARSSNGKA